MEVCGQWRLHCLKRSYLFLLVQVGLTVYHSQSSVPLFRRHNQGETEDPHVFWVLDNFGCFVLAEFWEQLELCDCRTSWRIQRVDPSQPKIRYKIRYSFIIPQRGYLGRPIPGFIPPPWTQLLLKMMCSKLRVRYINCYRSRRHSHVKLQEPHRAVKRIHLKQIAEYISPVRLNGFVSLMYLSLSVSKTLPFVTHTNKPVGEMAANNLVCELDS